MEENADYLSTQLITYLGNKRSLLPLISEGLSLAQIRLHKTRLTTFDVFSGSGVVSRFLKQYSSMLYTNDMEGYARIINECYLTNKHDFPEEEYNFWYSKYLDFIATTDISSGIISSNYAPKDINNIQFGERCFYTPQNAKIIDGVLQFLTGVPNYLRIYFLAPLLSEASIHANTSGVFKGFYKGEDGIGKFGGRGENALSRICGDIQILKPVLSNFSCDSLVMQDDAMNAATVIRDVDVAYLDPPYNQHPYGSNYFMLNVIGFNRIPEGGCSEISGIPSSWNRSPYNKKATACEELSELIHTLHARFVLLSYNTEGLIEKKEMDTMLEKHGDVNCISKQYNVFRGSRNLQNRSKKVDELLYIIEKR